MSDTFASQTLLTVNVSDTFLTTVSDAVPPGVVSGRVRHGEADADPFLGRLAQLDAANRPDRDDECVGLVVLDPLHVDRDHAEAGLGIEAVEHEAGAVDELDLDERLLDTGCLGERRDRPEQALDEGLVRPFRNRRPDDAQKSLVSAGAAPMWARPSLVIVRPRGVRWMKPSWSMNGS